ncbi:MAG: hypothetical protein HRT35_38055 [Algicola sp.]|nr:hypothetical protein [Algicola sp.]
MEIKFVLKAMVLWFLLIGNAHAAQTAYGKITHIKATGGQAYIYISGLNDPMNCGGASTSTLVRLYWSTPQADKLFSMVMSAQMAGKRVSFEGTCVSGYLSAKTVYIET